MNDMLTEREFYEASKHGCANCTEQAEVLEDHEIHWISANSFLCCDCNDEIDEELLDFNGDYSFNNKLYH